MRVSLGQPVIIENVGGADGSIAVGRAARAAPDGYTISIGNVATHVLNGAAFSLSYDLLHDLEAISLLTDAPAFIVAKNAVPAQDLKDLIVWLKANPDKMSAGTFATWGRLFGAYFQSSTGTRIQFVPYRGAAPAMQDLIAGTSISCSIRRQIRFRNCATAKSKPTRLPQRRDLHLHLTS